MDEQDVNEAAKLLAEDQDLSQAAKRLATAGAGDDIEALVILVMMEAADDAAEDLKALMDQMRSANAAKRRMRELICKVASDVAENIGRPDDGKLVFKGGGLGGEAEYHRAPVPSPNPACEAGVLMVATDLHPGKIRTPAQLEAIHRGARGEARQPERDVERAGPPASDGHRSPLEVARGAVQHHEEGERDARR